jgi:hypothetical protein
MADNKKSRNEKADKFADSSGYKEMMTTPLMSKLMGKSSSTTRPVSDVNSIPSKLSAKPIDVNSGVIQDLESGDSDYDILNKMFNFMKVEYHWKNEKHKKDTEYKKNIMEDQAKRSDELIGLFTGKKTKASKKTKVEKVSPKETKKPTAEKVNEPVKPSAFQRIATTAGAAAIGATVVGGALTVGNLIAKKGESGAAGYNAFNMGTKDNKIVAGKQKENLQDMTVGEVMSRQSIKWGSPNESQKLFAVGKYQMIPSTLSDAVKSLNVSKDEKFTPELQERMFKDYLISAKRPAIAKYLNSPTDDPELLKNAVRAMSREWASVADPDKGGTTSFYGSGNKALISVDEISNALRFDRENNLKKTNLVQQNLKPSVESQQIPDKVKGVTNDKTGAAVISNNTNVYQGGTSYNVTTPIQNNNAPILDLQYNN